MKQQQISDLKASGAEITGPVAAQEEPKIKKIAVIGAGVMGASIAALAASCGVEVVLLDLDKTIADDAVARMKKGSPSDALKMKKNVDDAGFYHPDDAKRITTGSSITNMDMIGDCDAIIEAVKEDLKIKGLVYNGIEKHKKPDAYVCSNTSTFTLDKLLEGRSDAFKENFLITHFFNPPRFLPLLEIVTNDDTTPEAIKDIKEFGTKVLGKTVVECEDSPGFIGNRIAIYMVKRAINETIKRGLSIEDVDALMGRNVGFSSMGLYRLLDMVGLDIVESVIKSLYQNLPDDDPLMKESPELPAYLELLDKEEAIRKEGPDDAEEQIKALRDAFYAEAGEIGVFYRLIEQGRTGKKSENEEGFYRTRKENGEPVLDEDGKKIIEAIDFKTGEYRETIKSDLKSAKAGRKGLRNVFETEDEGDAMAWEVLRDTLLYVATYAPDISADIERIDSAMRAGFDWKRGPFEMIDAMTDKDNEEETGLEWFVSRLEADGIETPPLLSTAMNAEKVFKREHEGAIQYMDFEGNYADVIRDDGVLLLSDIKLKQDPVSASDEASIWDLGDGVLCVELTGMKSSLGPGTHAMLNEAMDMVEKEDSPYQSIVVYSDESNFAFGANLGLAGFLMGLADYDKIDDVLHEGQMTYDRMRYFDAPIVAAVRGMALGGGCELVMHCSGVQATPETYAGLVETGVGFVPGWGGCKELIRRMTNYVNSGVMTIDAPEVMAFSDIAMGHVSSSAAYATQKQILDEETTSISRNGNSLLFDAKQKSIEQVPDHTPPERSLFRMAGRPMAALLEAAVDGFYREGQATWYDVIVNTALAYVLTGGDTDLTKELDEFDIMGEERKAFMTLVRCKQTHKRVASMAGKGKLLREEPLEIDVTPAELRARFWEIMRNVVIKDRPDGNPKISTSQNEYSAISEVDLKAMSGKEMAEYLADLVANDDSKPDSITSDLQSTFNQEAPKTRQYVLRKVGNLKGLATMGMSASKIVEAADAFLKAGSQKYKRDNDTDKNVTAVRVAMFDHYQRFTSEISQKLG